MCGSPLHRPTVHTRCPLFSHDDPLHCYSHATPTAIRERKHQYQSMGAWCAQGASRITQGASHITQGALRITQGALRITQGALHITQGASRAASFTCPQALHSCECEDWFTLDASLQQFVLSRVMHWALHPGWTRLHTLKSNVQLTSLKHVEYLRPPHSVSAP